MFILDNTIRKTKGEIKMENKRIGEYELIKESEFAVAIYKNGKLITRTGTMYTAEKDVLSGDIKKFEVLNK